MTNDTLLHPSRRRFLRTAGLCAGSLLLPARAARAAAPTRYLFTIAAFGGASIIDSFLPVREDESKNGARLTTFKDVHVLQPDGSNLRCVAPLNESFQYTPSRYSQSTFLQRHAADTVVMTVENSSVVHITAQQRSLNGGGSANRGRTIMETVAQQYGEGMLLPAANMATGGFLIPGTDPGLSARLAQVSVTDPASFPVSLHGSFGLPKPVPESMLNRARQARDRAEEQSDFWRTHLGTETLRKYLELQERAVGIERGGLMPQLLLRDFPGLSAAPEIARIREYLPSLETDLFEAQAALAFLLVKNGHTVAAAIGPNNAQTTETVDGRRVTQIYPTQTFDASHTGHRAGQSASWSRTFRVADSLIRLLKDTEDPRACGESMWANSLVYFATDFGRDKVRPENSLTFGSGHDLNNGTILVSPLLRGNRVYGGVDPDTCRTYGFDRSTGEPDRGTTMSEADVFGVICQALGVEFEGRQNVDCMIRA
jgi:hypothetical protein